MPSTSSMLARLKKDYPTITFKKSTAFRWSPAERAVYYENQEDAVSLLHEVAHAVLEHVEYRHDIELLEIERQAWDKTVSELSRQYGVIITDEEVENMLDTYRDWLHSRSLCPHCEATGLQKDKNHYECLACGKYWRVNEARTCALRRYKTK